MGPSVWARGPICATQRKFRARSSPVIASIWGVNQWLKKLALFLFLSIFQTLQYCLVQSDLIMRESLEKCFWHLLYQLIGIFIKTLILTEWSRAKHSPLKLSGNHTASRKRMISESDRGPEQKSSSGCTASQWRGEISLPRAIQTSLTSLASHTKLSA